MKAITITQRLSALLMLWSAVSFGQINNGSFSGVTVGTPTCPNTFWTAAPTSSAHFQQGCVPGGWWVSHGTPEIVYDGTNYFAHTWTGNWPDSGPGGEGIFQFCWTFHEGKAYQLNFKIRTRNVQNPSFPVHIDKVWIELANGLSHNYTINYTPPLGPSYQPQNPSSRQVIWEANQYQANNWTSVSVIFIPDRDYRNIWFYPEDDDVITSCYFDDIELVCLPNITYSNTSSLPWFTTRRDYIKAASGGIGVRVLNGQRVTFTAGGYIELNPGFSAEAGSMFYAYIAGCDMPECYEADVLRLAPPPEESKTEPSREVTIYPNPTNGRVFLQSERFTESTVVAVYNATGQQLLTLRPGLSQQLEFSLSDQPKGIYLIHVLNGDDVTIHKVMRD